LDLFLHPTELQTWFVGDAVSEPSTTTETLPLLVIRLKFKLGRLHGRIRGSLGKTIRVNAIIQALLSQAAAL
jgi:hypothetical protein